LSIAASANETLANVMPSDFGPGNEQDSANFLSGINQYALGMSQNAMFADPSIAWPTPPQVPTHDNFVDLSPEHKQNGEQRTTSFPRPIAINPNAPTPATGLMANFGSLSKPVQKANVRKRFDPERKKEVQKLRQMGACIRAQKKPLASLAEALKGLVCGKGRAHVQGSPTHSLSTMLACCLRWPIAMSARSRRL
jgi:hypothetical protein